MYKKIELITNISIVFIAALLAVVVVKNHLLPSRVKEITEGNTIQLTDVDWTENKHTLLLALSPRCRFCVDSAPFYQRLVKKADDDHIALIVLTPVPTAQAQDFLREIDVLIRDVRRVDFAAHNIRGTPTLILVNNKGVAIKVWRGALPSDTQEEVFALMRNARPMSSEGARAFRSLETKFPDQQ